VYQTPFKTLELMMLQGRSQDLTQGWAIFLPRVPYYKILYLLELICLFKNYSVGGTSPTPGVIFNFSSTFYKQLLGVQILKAQKILTTLKINISRFLNKTEFHYFTSQKRNEILRRSQIAFFCQSNSKCGKRGSQSYKVNLVFKKQRLGFLDGVLLYFKFNYCSNTP